MVLRKLFGLSVSLEFEQQDNYLRFINTINASSKCWIVLEGNSKPSWRRTLGRPVQTEGSVRSNYSTSSKELFAIQTFRRASHLQTDAMELKLEEQGNKPLEAGSFSRRVSPYIPSYPILKRTKSLCESASSRKKESSTFSERSNRPKTSESNSTQTYITSYPYSTTYYREEKPLSFRNSRTSLPLSENERTRLPSSENARTRLLSNKRSSLSFSSNREEQNFTRPPSLPPRGASARTTDDEYLKTIRSADSLSRVFEREQSKITRRPSLSAHASSPESVKRTDYLPDLTGGKEKSVPTKQLFDENVATGAFPSDKQGRRKIILSMVGNCGNDGKKKIPNPSTEFHNRKVITGHFVRAASYVPKQSSLVEDNYTYGRSVTKGNKINRRLSCLSRMRIERPKIKESLASNLSLVDETRTNSVSVVIRQNISGGLSHLPKVDGGRRETRGSLASSFPFGVKRTRSMTTNKRKRDSGRLARLSKPCSDRSKRVSLTSTLPLDIKRANSLSSDTRNGRLLGLPTVSRARENGRLPGPSIVSRAIENGRLPGSSIVSRARENTNLPAVTTPKPKVVSIRMWKGNRLPKTNTFTLSSLRDMRRSEKGAAHFPEITLGTHSVRAMSCLCDQTDAKYHRLFARPWYHGK